MTILIADSDLSFAKVARETLEKEGYRVRIGHDDEETMNEALHLPDLIILDVAIPGIGGWHVAARLRSQKATASIPILFVAERPSEFDELLAFQLSATDYITKPCSRQKLATRVRLALRGSTVGDTSAIEIGPLKIDAKGHSVSIKGIPISLPLKTFELLVYLAQHRGHVVPRETLVRTLFGETSTLPSRTLDVHIYSLREKFGGYGRFIRTVKSVGYKLDSDW